MSYDTVNAKRLIYIYLFVLQLEFTPSFTGLYKYAKLSPKYFNRFGCDGDFKNIENRQPDRLAEAIHQAIQGLDSESTTDPEVEQAVPTEDDDQQPPSATTSTTARQPARPRQQREKRRLPPLFSRAKKNKATESITHIKGIQERCNECLLDSK